MIIFKSIEINNDKHKQNNNINNDYQDHDHDDDHGDAVMVHSCGDGIAWGVVGWAQVSSNSQLQVWTKA